jgi:hypothetical protein
MILREELVARLGPIIGDEEALVLWHMVYRPTDERVSAQEWGMSLPRWRALSSQVRRRVVRSIPALYALRRFWGSQPLVDHFEMTYEELCDRATHLEAWQSWERERAKLQEAGLSNLIVNALGRAGYRSVAAVTAATDGELLAIPGFGQRSLRRVQAALPQDDGGAVNGTVPDLVAAGGNDLRAVGR